RFLEIAFVANRADALDLVLVHQLRDTLFNAISSLLVRNLGDDDAEAAFGIFLDARASPQNDRSPARIVSTANSTPSADDAPRRKIRPRDNLQQFIDRHIGLIDH